MKTLLNLTMLVACLSSITIAQPGLITRHPSEDSCEVIESMLTLPIPIIRNDMSWEVVTTYLVADTVCKALNKMQIDSLVKLLSDDSLLVAIRSCLKCQDYDYLLYYHQTIQTILNKPDNYKASFFDLEKSLFAEWENRHGPFSKITNILRKCIIIRARVTNVIERTDIGFSGDILPPFDTTVTHTFCAELQLVDIIFGNPRYYFIRNSSEDGDQRMQCSWGTFESLPINGVFEPPLTSYVPLQINSEYIFVISMGPLLFRQPNVCNITPWRIYTFPIDSDEIVFDPDNTLGNGTEGAYQAFKYHIQSLIGF